jgi:hypothetical protein
MTVRRAIGRKLATGGTACALAGALMAAGTAQAAATTTPACPAPVISGSTATVTCRFIKNVGAQYWTVPAGVTQATFTLHGGTGGQTAAYTGPGGIGAEVTGTLPVTPGSVLQVNVGRAGKNSGGAFGGGGPGGGDGGGGGASDIRDGAYTLADRLLVAGGGGGGGGESSDGPGGAFAAGGAGGDAGSPGEAGASAVDFCGETVPGGGGGGAGTATAGGAGGAGNSSSCDGGNNSASNGAAGSEGSGGAGSAARGGGGGGGYYGGGGGGGNTFAPSPVTGGGGGGGGSSYTGTATGASVNDDPASPRADGDGEVIITYAEVLTSHNLSGHETSVSCLSASLCVAVGSRHYHGVVVTLINGPQSDAAMLPGSAVLDSVSCRASGCWAIGHPEHGAGAYLVKISSAGRPAAEQTVPVPAGTSLGPVSCASMTSCEIAGADNHIKPAAIEIGSWTGTSLHLRRVALTAGCHVPDHKSHTGCWQVVMGGISCWHADCEAVGYARVGPWTKYNLILSIKRGRPGKLFDADNGYFVTHVFCVSAATCYASGGAYLYTVTDGVPAGQQTIPDGGQNSLSWGGIECTGTVCEAAGKEEYPGYAWVGVLVSLSDGTAGAPTFVDDSGGFTGIAGRAGTGFIAIGGGSTTRTEDTVG